MSNNDVIYAAGFIDGEGCMTSLHSSFRLTISSTDKDILIWFKDTFGGNVNNQYLPKNPNHHMAWKWVMCAKKDLLEFLELVYPYLKMKDREVKIVIDFLNKYSDVKCGRRVPQSEKDEFFEVKKLLKKFKTDKLISS